MFLHLKNAKNIYFKKSLYSIVVKTKCTQNVKCSRFECPHCKDSDILTKVGWMPLEYFYKFRNLTITHNAYYHLGLREINYLVTKNSNSHNLRKSLNVVLNRPEIVLGRRSFVHRSAIAWNALPDNLKDSSNSSIFKYNLKQSKRTIMNINFGKGGIVIYNMKPDFHYY